jgi:hypothetical protein
MIIGHDFVWGHLGKTGGDATLALFRLFPRLIVKADAADTHAKHATFLARQDQLAGKRLLLNIRRLDAWIVSYAQHRAKWGLYPNKPMPLWTADEMADSTFPDHALSGFLQGGKFKIDRWLRTEYLRWDFLGFVSEITDVTAHERQQVLSMPSINAMKYDHDLRHWFTADQRERLYKNNPIWAGIEREVYRDRALPFIADSLQEAQSALNICRVERADLEHELAELRMAIQLERNRIAAVAPEAITSANDIDAVSEKWDQVRSVRKAVNATVPLRAVLAVISKGDENMVRFDGRIVRHFPQDSTGEYAGHYPADSSAAIRHLEKHQSAGVTHLVVPKAAFWWLDHYTGFAEHLHERHRRVCDNELCIIYALEEGWHCGPVDDRRTYRVGTD